jgi:hypothetical protein
MLIANGLEAVAGECAGALMGLTGSALTGKAHFDNGDVVLQADIV